MSRSKVIFSIPGRIRIHNPILMKDKKTVSYMMSAVEDIPGVISVSANRRTGNLLVCYDKDAVAAEQITDRMNHLETGRIIQRPLSSLARNIVKTLNPVLFMKKHSNTPLQNEYHLAKRVFKFTVFLSGTVFVFKLLIKRLLAMLVFACPVMILAIPLTALYYAAVRAGNRGIYLKGGAEVERLRLTKTVYIHDSVLASGSRREAKKLIFQKLDHPELRRLLELEKLNDLLNIKITDFVFGIRENGITDIALAVDADYEFIDIVAGRLGIERIFKLQDNISLMDFFHDHTIVVTAEEHKGNLRHETKGFVLYVYNHSEHNSDEWDFAEANHNSVEWSDDAVVQSSNLQKIPWVIGLSRYCKELIVRCENSAIALNSLGLLMSALGYLNPIGALSIYSVNMTGQMLYIRKKMLAYRKDAEPKEKSPLCLMHKEK